MLAWRELLWTAFRRDLAEGPLLWLQRALHSLHVAMPARQGPQHISTRAALLEEPLLAPAQRPCRPPWAAPCQPGQQSQWPELTGGMQGTQGLCRHQGHLIAWSRWS